MLRFFYFCDRVVRNRFCAPFDLFLHPLGYRHPWLTNTFIGQKNERDITARKTIFYKYSKINCQTFSSKPLVHGINSHMLHAGSHLQNNASGCGQFAAVFV